MSRPKPAPLVEGVDYYMEGGKLVFTSAYHEKRGYCCNSRCRHCPYGSDGGLGLGHERPPRIDFAVLPAWNLSAARLRGR